MEALVLICLVWLIVLQITVNRLEEQVEKLSTGKSPVTPPQGLPEKDVPPQATPVQESVPEVAAASSHEDAPESQPPSPIEQPRPQSTPAFEITAAKLFSWIGGLMLFLGCVWAIKYAVDNNLLSPALRITLSLGLGVILAVCGYSIQKEKYRVMAHTLLGSGLAIVYVAIYCAHALYHFISLGSAFILLAVTSFVTLGISLKKEAKYVGYLGAIIAFLTPLLLNSGQDAWVIFFLYVFCINAAAAYGAIKKRWYDLFICTLSLTWLCQAAWLTPFASYKLLGVSSFFSLYALASAWLARREESASAISRTIGGFLCAGLLLMLPVAAALTTNVNDSLLFLSYVFLVNLLVLALTGKNHLSTVFARIAKVLSFLVLLVWLVACGPHAQLWLTLGACMIFAALNSAVELLPIFGRRETAVDAFSLLYPVAVMGGLFILSILMGQISALYFIGLFSVLGLFLAGVVILAVLAHLMWVAFVAVGLLFLFLIVSLLLGTGGVGFTPCLLLSGLVPMFLCGGALLLLRRAHRLDGVGTAEKVLSALTALMPFSLILLVTQLHTSLHLHWILATTYVVCVLNILAARLYKSTFTLPVAAVGAGLVQLALWQGVTTQTVPAFSGWLIALLVLFVGVPFLSREHFWQKEGTWIACAVAGLAACLFGCGLVSEYVPQAHTGLVPGALLCLYTWLLYHLRTSSPAAQTQPLSVAFMSAAVLFFLTLIFPLEIHTYWLAVAWAAEAAALAYLHTRLPYRGWQIVSAGLMCVVALWLLLAMNFTPLPPLRIWNWYLWVYGLCAGALWMTSKWWQQPAPWKVVFNVLVGCVLFWLLNIEIAHWFHTEDTLDFNFTGQVAEALTYTLAWAFFGISTIWIGLRTQKSVVAKVGIGVMSLALLKFFLSDIWQLELLYRILGAFGLAILLITTSYWYQKRQPTR